MSIHAGEHLLGSFQQIKEQTDGMLDDLITIRRDIHAHPEERFQEVRTAKIVVENLRRPGIEVQTGVGVTGVVGTLRGGLGEGKVLGIRCDMDALPIQEKSDVPYRSRSDGKMHACGHDVHTTVGIGIARILASMRESFRGTIKFIFQPSEEIPHGEKSGALEMIKDGVLEAPHVDAIFSLHCWPDLNAGQVGVRAGPAMAAAEAFLINMIGQQAHAASPHRGRDAILGAAEVITSLHHIISRRTDPSIPFALNVGYIEGGSPLGIIAGLASLSGTVRTLSKESMEFVTDLIKNTVDGVSQVLDLKNEVILDDFFPPVINDSHLNEIVSFAASQILGSENVIVQEKCPMTAEDFAHFTDKLPGYYLKVGVANDSKGIRFPLHSEFFDVDERAIAVGVSVLAAAAMTYLVE